MVDSRVVGRRVSKSTNRFATRSLGWKWAIVGAMMIAIVVIAYLALRNTEPTQTQTRHGEGETRQPRPQAEDLHISGHTGPADLNIIMITVDTLRSDRVSSYGSTRVDTPHIDGFANEGVLFSNAASTVPFTLPAHASILTGLYPPAHGVRENVGYTLSEEVPTLAEILSEAGWSTAGFVSAFVLDRRWGIGRGFDHFFDDFDLSEMEKANLSSVQRGGDETIVGAVRWLDERPQERPFFLWLHLYDPHDPYTPPEPYRSLYPNRPYDGEVAYTDLLIGDFRQALTDRGLLEDSLVILTSDHGEGLGDHGESFHGFFVYDTTVHAVLIMRPPKGLPRPLVVDTAVSHVDLLPTILDAVDVSPPETTHGESLVPALLGRPLELDRGVYSESLYPLLHYGWSALRALRTDHHKLIDEPRPKVFELKTDPQEQINLYTEAPAVSEDLEGRLASLREVIDRELGSSTRPPDLDPETLAQLQALGYAAGQGGVTLDQEEDRPRSDPKDKIGLHRRVMRAQSQMRTDADAAEKTLLELLDEDSEILDAHQMLGQLTTTQKRFDEAVNHFRHALEIDSDHQNSIMGLASSYKELGRNEEALIGFKRILEITGGDTRASLAMADILVAERRLDEAASVLGEALSTTELAGLIYNKLGEVRVEQGRSEIAQSLFVKAIQEKDDWPLPHFNLAVLYEERGEIQPAMASYNRAIELAPNYHQAQFNLGRLMGQLGRVDRQQELWERAIESSPKFVQGHYYLSKLLMDRGGDLGRAEELVRAGIAADPKHREGPLGYYILADILNRTGRSAEAQEAVRMGREIQAAANR